MQINCISLSEPIPDETIFDFIEYQPLNIKITSKYVVRSTEKFYDRGIIELFIQDSSKLENRFDSNETINVINNNWLFAFIIMDNYYHILTGKSITNPIDINIVTIGDYNNGFILGVYYFLYLSTFSYDNKYLRNNKLKWFGFDKKNTEIDDNPNIIHGYPDDNIYNIKNYNMLKVCVIDKLYNINILYNNIKPIQTDVNSFNIILLYLILVLECLNKNGIFITRIIEPEYWKYIFSQYILLIAFIFKNVYILRIPISKNDTVYFEYYCVAYHKKKVSYTDVIKSRFLHTYRQNKFIKIKSKIMDNEHIIKWIDNLYNINPSNPVDINAEDDLNDIINNIKDKL